MLEHKMPHNGHEVVVGRTQSGKTYYAMDRARNHVGPVLFFNPQGFPNEFIEVDSKVSVEVFRGALKNGCKMQYIPSSNDRIGVWELEFLVKELMQAGKKVLLIGDEAQDFSLPLRKVARRGLAKGVKGIFITPRPADMHNTMLTQGSRHVIFNSEWEAGYFKSYGLPGDEIKARLLTSKLSHPFVIWQGGRLLGPFSL